jgi:transcriptional regulator with XRE-family HTH domain
MEIGNKLKQIRLKQGLSLEQLAKKVGVTKSFLSQVEKNKSSPSLASLIKILRVLNVSMHEFFQENRHRKGVVLRKGDRRSFYNEKSGVRFEILSSGFANPKMEPVYAEIEKDKDTDFISAEGELFGVILHGTIELTSGTDTYILHQGDSIYLDSSVPHKWRNIGSGKASGIWVSTYSALDTF